MLTAMTGLIPGGRGGGKGAKAVTDLAMDEVSRLARARGMGFRDLPLYHGTAGSFPAFDLRQGRGSTGSPPIGVWAAELPEDANEGWKRRFNTVKTICPELKRIHSPDVFDLDNPSLRENEPYCVLIQAMFGPEGVDGEESFDLLVCNNLWVERQSRLGAFSSGHRLIVARFDIDEIRAFLEKAASKSSGASWEEAARKLGRYGKWEFEGYDE